MKKRELRINLRVQEAISEIENYLLENESEARANKIIISFYYEFEKISATPFIYPQIFFRKNKDIHIRKGVLHKTYIFYYEVTDESVEILLLIHGSRNPKRISSLLKKF